MSSYKSSLIFLKVVGLKRSKFRKYTSNPQFLPFQLTVIRASWHETNLWKFYKGYKVLNGTLIRLACGQEDNTLQLHRHCYNNGDWVSLVKGKVVLISVLAVLPQQECSCGPSPSSKWDKWTFSSHRQQRESEQSGREIRHQRIKD